MPTVFQGHMGIIAQIIKGKYNKVTKRQIAMLGACVDFIKIRITICYIPLQIEEICHEVITSSENHAFLMVKKLYRTMKNSQSDKDGY
jgi:hypothetical protein